MLKVLNHVVFDVCWKQEEIRKTRNMDRRCLWFRMYTNLVDLGRLSFEITKWIWLQVRKRKVILLFSGSWWSYLLRHELPRASRHGNLRRALRIFHRHLQLFATWHRSEILAINRTLGGKGCSLFREVLVDKFLRDHVDIGQWVESLSWSLGDRRHLRDLVSIKEVKLLLVLVAVDLRLRLEVVTSLRHIAEILP